MTCTFFGHSVYRENVSAELEKAIIALIENNGVSLFYVGNQGEFDRIVLRVLQKLSTQYGVRYYVVLAYMPRADIGLAYENTLFPEEMELAVPRFAIDKRNRWMIERSDYVITYVRNSYGRAAKYRTIADKKGKRIIDI